MHKTRTERQFKTAAKTKGDRWRQKETANRG